MHLFHAFHVESETRFYFILSLSTYKQEIKEIHIATNSQAKLRKMLYARTFIFLQIVARVKEHRK